MIKKIEEEFDKIYPHILYENIKDADSGYDVRPYIKSFYQKQIEKLLKEERKAWLNREIRLK